MAGPLLRGSGELHIVGSHDVTTIPDPDGAVHRLLGLADGSRTRAEILEALVNEFPQLAEREVDHALSELESVGLLEDAAPPRGRILGSRGPRRDGHERTPLSVRTRVL
jgi:hypothetical protein